MAEDNQTSSSENIEIPPISKQAAGAATGALIGAWPVQLALLWAE